MKVGLVGPSYQESSRAFDYQRTVNLYPVVDETKQGKEISALYGTPGLLEFKDFTQTTQYIAGDSTTIRAEFASTNGRAFVVSGKRLYEQYENGDAAYRGDISSTDSPCLIVENPTQMAINDGQGLWIFTYATNVLAQVTDVDYPGLATITFMDGYFIGNKPNTGEFYISGLNDGFSWSSLDFATAESSPDNLVRVYAAYGQLWLIGSVSAEVWYNTGDVTFPFSRIEGAKMQTGCAAALSVLDIGNTIVMLGQDTRGKGIVYIATGYSFKRISTTAIEKLLQASGDLTAIRAYAYQDGGHLFYTLTGGQLETSLTYDLLTGQWHERANLLESGEYSTHSATTYMYAFGKHLVGDKTLGVVFEMSQDYYYDSIYDDGGGVETPRYIKRQRIFTHIHDEAKRFTVNELQVDFEYGQGLTSTIGEEDIDSVGTRLVGETAIAYLAISEDGGHTWSKEYPANIGAVGEYKARAVWRRLGMMDICTFRVTISDPVRVVICGAYMR